MGPHLAGPVALIPNEMKYKLEVYKNNICIAGNQVNGKTFTYTQVDEYENDRDVFETHSWNFTKFHYHYE